MLTPVRSGQFKRDVRRAEKRGKDMAKRKAVLLLLIEQKVLPARYNDHLLYRVEGDELELTRTGMHADLFDE